MKSIKEKAEETYPIITRVLQTYNEKFIEGANYVLEVVESILEDQELDVKETYYKIYATIEQLKK